MSQRNRRALAACAALPLALFLALPSTAHAIEGAPPEDPGSEGGPAASTTGSGLGDAVIAAVESGAVAPDEIAAEVGVAPSNAGGGFSYDAEGRLLVTVIVDPAAGEASQLIGEVAEVGESLAPVPGVAAWVAPERMEELANIAGVSSVIPMLAPMSSSALSSGQALAPTTLPAAQADTCGPVPIEADGPLDSAEARERFGVDGSGVTIGIISDSFANQDSPASWADDVASGALPGPGNPCGYTTPVEVLADLATGGSDEGRAMAQLVHGVAPGAKLVFANMGASESTMAQHIEDLAAAGADIIVDDVSFLTEAYYQRSFISQTIEQVKETHGVLYLTSAGNSNGTASEGAHEDDPVGSWQTSRYRETACPAWVTKNHQNGPLPAGADCLDFDPDPAVAQAYDVLTIGGAAGDGTAELRPIGSIGEPMFGVTTEYELHYYESCSTTPTLISALPAFGGQLPSGKMLYPGLAGSVTVNQGSEVCMVMVRTSHEAGTNPAVYLGHVRGANWIAERQFMGNRELGALATDWVGESVFGHSGDGSAIGVGSAAWDEPTQMRPFSSLGPTTLLYEGVNMQSADLNPTPRLASPLLVSSPQVTAVDGTQTTFFGGNEGTPEAPEYRFYGTSAAAPLAAAVAALGKQQAPAITQGELAQVLRDTARGTAEGGPVNPYVAAGFEDGYVFGAGRVSATRLIEALPERPATPGELRLASATASELSFEWAQVVRAASLTAELYDGDAANGTPIASFALAGDATAQQFTGLASNRGYTMRLVAQGEQGALSESTLAAHTLAEAPRDLAVDAVADQSIAVSWSENAAPDHYIVKIAPAGGAALGTPVTLPAGSTSFTFTGLTPGTDYSITVEALNSMGAASGASVEAKTSGASAAAGGGTGADADAGTGTGTGTKSPGLATTGGQNLTPYFVAGGVLLLLGAAAIAFTQQRKRRRSMAEAEAEAEAEADTGLDGGEGTNSR